MTRRADLIQLEQIASGYPSRERFLTELRLDPPDATYAPSVMRAATTRCVDTPRGGAPSAVPQWRKPLFR